MTFSDMDNSIEQLIDQWTLIAGRYAKTVTRIRYNKISNLNNKILSEKILKGLAKTQEDEISEKSKLILDSLNQIADIIWKPSDRLEKDLERLEEVLFCFYQMTYCILE